MKNITLLFIFLVPAFLFAQYPATGNKQRLGYQTTGDGLIWRGVAADTAIKPRTTANAYFQLDTVNRVLRRYIATQGSWQVVGATPDLSIYLEIADTAAMLSNYTTFGDVAANYFPLQGGTLTGTGGAGFIGFPSQVVAPGAPASGLNVYAQGSSFNWKGTDGFERQFASTLTGGRTYTLPDVSGTFALGTGTTDRSARWSATNTQAAGNFTDNGIKLQALLPFQLHQWTTAGRPTGVTGYKGYNTTTGFEEGYFTIQWENFITSTGAANGQVSIFSSAGKTYGTNNFFWDNTNVRLGIGTSSPTQRVDIYSTANAGNYYIARTASSGNSASAGFVAESNTANDQTTFARAGSGVTPYKMLNPRDSYIYHFNGGDILLLNDNAAGRIKFAAGASSTVQLLINTNGNVLIGTTTDVSRRLHVSGEARITDLTTDTPTRIVGADADGDLGAIALSSNFTISSGTLTLISKRDTTIYVTDADYNFGTAITSANVLARYNRIIIYSKLTASATSDNQIILPSASSDFLQCTISVYSNDASGDADATSVDFTTNGAVDGAGGTLSSYALTSGQKVEIRPTDDGGFKWFFN